MFDAYLLSNPSDPRIEHNGFEQKKGTKFARHNWASFRYSKDVTN
jgi:hypothetical protein